MKNPAFLALLATILAAGCFSGSKKTPTILWTITPPEAVSTRVQDVKWPVVRIGAVTVASPCENMPILVKRQNGSVARDPVNQFAAAPAALMRPALAAALAEDGRFGVVLGPGSNAAADVVVDCHVTELALDCPSAGARFAMVKLDIDVTEASRTSRKLVSRGHGEGRVNALSGNYTTAFSSAAANALRQALGKL